MVKPQSLMFLVNGLVVNGCRIELNGTVVCDGVAVESNLIGLGCRDGGRD